MEDGAYRFGEFSLFPSERQLLSKCNEHTPACEGFRCHVSVGTQSRGLVLRQELIQALWPDIHVTEANLTNIIVLLRKILGREAIETVSKYGYRFTLPVLGEPGVRQAAYASFVRGKELAAERSPESIFQARDLFWLCLANDPNFAPAWAWLGRCCRMLEKFKAGPSINLDIAETAFRRALAIDPNLACAHHFYTQLQADLGQALHAMTRLAARLKQHGEEPETFAGLVQVLRFCGLMEESVAAHERAIALDPTVSTSVAHTYFLQGEYERVFETYVGKRYYLDAAAWAAMGDTDHAIAVLHERLTHPKLSPLMFGLMASLLAVLEGRSEEAIAVIEHTEVLHEPELLFYLARHLAMLNVAPAAVEMLQRARRAGFSSSRALEQDAAFAEVRNQPGFDHEREEAKSREAHASQILHETLGCDFLTSRRMVHV